MTKLKISPIVAKSSHRRLCLKRTFFTTDKKCFKYLGYVRSKNTHRWGRHHWMADLQLNKIVIDQKWKHVIMVCNELVESMLVKLENSCTDILPPTVSVLCIDLWKRPQSGHGAFVVVIVLTWREVRVVKNRFFLQKTIKQKRSPPAQGPYKWKIFLFRP